MVALPEPPLARDPRPSRIANHAASNQADGACDDGTRNGAQRRVAGAFVGSGSARSKSGQPSRRKA